MRKARFLSLLLILCLASVSVLADGVTLRTVSSFAGANPAAEAYLDTLKAYEARTGNTVVDVSAASDETWKTSVSPKTRFCGSRTARFTLCPSVPTGKGCI